jgi:tetrahedral aminopeptidase
MPKSSKGGSKKGNVVSIEDVVANGHTSESSHRVHSFGVTLLKRLTETPGTSGREEQVRALVVSELTPLVDDLRVDAMGNVIAVKRGSGNTKVMLAAHMDEIGFIVKHIDSKGYLRVQPIGGHDPSVLVAQRVLVHTAENGALRGVLTPSRKPIHLQRDKAESAPTLNDLFVDLGLTAEEVQQSVEIGDFVTMDRTLEVVGECVISKALDDRAGLFVMIETMRRLKALDVTVYAVATVQEEVGLRGATAAAYDVNPDIAIALDTTLAVELPGAQDHEAVTHLGEGVAIKVMDGGHIAHPKLLRHLRAIARRENIAHQMEVLPGGTTDASAMQRSRGGNVSATLSLPSRYVHTVNEMVHLDDIEAAIALLTAYLAEVHPDDYAY